MFSLNQTFFNSDRLGIISSGLCMIHCLATPFLFVAKSCSTTCCADAPLTWKLIDFLFLAVSYFAIYWTAKNTSKEWMKYALWSSWALLFVFMLNEHSGLFSIPSQAFYTPAILLIGLHIYNMKYCRCSDNSCCVDG